MKNNKRENLIVSKSLEFSLKIIELYKEMVKGHEYVISKQILRSGTSIGANVQEAQAAQSRKDFISKMSIASKEERETKYWISLLDKSELIPDCHDHILSLYSDIDDIINILSKIVKTSSLQEK